MDFSNFGLDGLLSFVLIGYSIILHEIAHGYAALRFGDPTAERMDRITLNPLSHIDPMGTVILPLLQLALTGRVMLGWAKPVPVNPLHLEPRVAGEIVVSVAGVAVNLAIAFAMAILLGFEPIAPVRSSLYRVLLGVMVANVGLAVFNLLPIPPLDGSHVLKHLLPPGIREQYEQIGFYGTVILLVLISQGLLDPIIDGPIDFLIRTLFREVTLRLRGI